MEDISPQWIPAPLRYLLTFGMYLGATGCSGHRGLAGTVSIGLEWQVELASHGMCQSHASFQKSPGNP